MAPAGRRQAGLAVPGKPVRLVVGARLDRAAAAYGPLQATVQVTDAAGVSYALPAGLLPADGRLHQLVTHIPGQRALYPLQLTGISFGYTLPAKPAPTTVLRITGLTAAPTASGPLPALFASGQALARWISPMTAPGLGEAVSISGDRGAPRAGPQSAPVVVPEHGAALLRFGAGFGLASPVPGATSPIQGTLTLAERPAAEPIAAVATRAYLAASGASAGDTVTLTYGPVTVRARITAVVDAFPTVTGATGGLIVDLPALQSVLTSKSAAVLPVSQWWLRAPGPPRGLPAGTAVTYRRRIAAALLSDPLSGLPQQALPAIALAAAVIAGVGYSVSVTAVVRERRAQNALLAALGVSRASRAGTLCLEQLMLSVPAAVAGIALGAGLARLIVAAVTLTGDATVPVPPVLLEVPWAPVTALAAAVAAVPVLAAALTIGRSPDPAAELRAAEAV